MLAWLFGAIALPHGTLAAIVDVGNLVETFGYPLLFLLVAAESSGIPIPGETSLIAAAVLASQGKLHIELVIPLAAAAAIVGDNIGYFIGRRGGRWLLERPGAFQRQRHQALLYGESFFARHGPKAVFFGRFVLGLRVWASWLAGATRMRWRSFVFWNALGGICWATAIGMLAYSLGKAAGSAVEAFGIYGLVAVVVVVLAIFFEHRRQRRRRPAVEPEPPAAGRPRTPTT
ncbi:MAG TPA: DedA family protein [Solirubrobacteraceae bacterium]|nr:DedA family protein [Solirubrobacteraceae bacterium]